MLCITNPEKDRSVRSIDAFSFAGVVRQNLAQFTKPIMEYTAKELLWALDSLARMWYSIEYDESVEEYISSLSLRYGILIRCGFGPDEYGDESLRKRPANDGDKSVVCSPSKLFKDLATARLSALIGAGWRILLHRRVDISGLCSVMKSALDRQRGSADVFASQGIQNSLRSAGERPLMNTDFAALQVAELLLRYTNESATLETSREYFSVKLVECSLCPGDMDVFSVKHRHMSKTPSNTLKMLRGDRFSREVFRKARLIGPEPFLRSAVSKLRQRLKEKSALGVIRSVTTLEEEIAGLCVMDTLFKNRHGVCWLEEFLITGHNHQTFVSEGVIPRECDERGLGPDVSYSRLPRVAMLCNTFDLLFEGTLYHSSSVFETIAWWLEIISLVYCGRILKNSSTQNHIAMKKQGDDSRREFHDSVGPTTSRKKKKNRAIEEEDTSVCYHDVRALCDIVRKGHETYVIRSDGMEITKVNIVRRCGTEMKIIDDST